MSRMTGERPVREVTPDSVLALHDAGYREVLKRLGDGIVLDLGCGLGFETVKFTSENRTVVGLDYDQEAASYVLKNMSGNGLMVARTDCSEIGIKSNSIDFVSSSHLIEHFVEPAKHVFEISRVLKDSGTAFFLTPNITADFENPFHVFLFNRSGLESLLKEHFEEVWVGGIEAHDKVKDEIAQRRKKASKVYALDKFDLRHKMPKSWWIWFYTKALPIGQKLIYRSAFGGETGITEDDFFVSNDVDNDTPVLFAIAKVPKSVRF